MATAAKVHEFDFDFIKRDPVSGPARTSQSTAELDVSESILEDLALKTLYLAGSLSVLELSEKLHLSYGVTNELFTRLRADVCCQVTGMRGNIPQIAITASGRQRASDLLSQNRYVGAAPVSFDSYVKQVQKQSVKKANAHAADLDRAFAHLVMDSETLRQLGTALNSGSSLFLYGPAGTGKTTIAEVLSRVLAEDDVWIPHAVEVDGQIITVYDPSIHKGNAKSEFNSHDPRWVLCHRPAVLVGGELTAEMLDLQFNAVSKFYVGPVQMKANNGVLIIDDFGRQRLRPEELLNRWIVPLDRRVDYLTMAGGKKIEVPFEMLVVFASNLDPAELVDPSFIRRIKTKIKVGAVSEEQFCEIFRRVADENQVQYDPEIPDDLIHFIQGTLNEELRSCYPRDIVEQVCWAASYDEKAPYLNRTTLKQAIGAYFLKSRKAAAPLLV
jgi:predicted ATPase with chaperone activity